MWCMLKGFKGAMQPSLNPTTSTQDHSKPASIVSLIKTIKISQSEITLVFYGRHAAAAGTPVMTVQTLLDPKVVFTQMSYPKKRFFAGIKRFFAG